jgi:YHS domain-containing protein
MRQTALLLVALLGLYTVLIAQDSKRQQGFNVSSKYVAIKGYDPVAYFTRGKAVEGKAAYAAMYDGITYYFSSPQNRAEFLMQPGKFEPQYGGWCAYAMGATGEKVEVDVETFKIISGKLYLFYNSFFNNTLKAWNKDEKNLNAKADVNWVKRF